MTPQLRFLGLFIACALCSACYTHGQSASAAALYADAKAHDPRGKPYVIGVADVVHVGVWKDESLSADAIVRPDGTITIPYVGELRAAGRTAAQLQQDASQRLATLVKDATVTVSVTEINSYRFTVAGNVEHPGLFTARYYLTVSEALALAGGPNRYADTDEVVVVRPSGTGLVRIPINYDDILSGKSPEQDIVVLAGDSVRVP
ncbi:MAG TPA: polysaccharide biosynthesis/export family protein [Polyangiaceae bacterium]|nr:polysaccharide biosynthesis/export family protein [Polyangiaceae bacterium]